MTEQLTELNTLAWGFPGGARGREPSSQCRRHKRHGFDPWVRKIEKENGNPLQYSCLENSLDRGAWWATILGVTHAHILFSWAQ